MLTKRGIESELKRDLQDMAADAHALAWADLFKGYVNRKLSPARIAEVSGKSRSYVGNMLRLLNLPEEAIREFVADEYPVTVVIDALKHAKDDGELAYRYLQQAVVNAAGSRVSVQHLPKHKPRPNERLSNACLKFIALYDSDRLTDDDIDLFVAEAKKLVVAPRIKRVVAEAPRRRRGVPV